jgi:hypothetical protein
MRRLILLGLLLSLVPACTRHYSHGTKGPTEFYADSSSCAGLAGQAAGHYDPYAVVRSRVYEECLFGKGWTRADAPSTWKPSTAPIEQPYTRAIDYQEILKTCREQQPNSVTECVNARLH